MLETPTLTTAPKAFLFWFDVLWSLPKHKCETISHGMCLLGFFYIFPHNLITNIKTKRDKEMWPLSHAVVSHESNYG